ncbi:1-phosphofructokinase family hexose kinase [uncultured Actinomyces sp.]|uniref:1-phosphofructokinase family hexose kinase n=1 Tax=uncultured Actinomyces sp. TaxID=249061 RepID=UPI00288BA6AE|nr:1-phosphofructokinase family hexose kinase [uncultured Actinomyces sp.]
MITTLTPNPSLDRTVSLPGELIRGGVNRLTGVTIEPGGKGLNVARVLVGAGQTVTAVLPASTHDPLLRALDAVAADGLRVRPVAVAGSARINTAVTEPDGTTTKLNEPGAGLDDEEIAAVERALVEAVRRGDGADGAADADATSAVGPAVAPGAGGVAAEEDADAAEASAWADSAPAAHDWAILSGSLPPGAPVDWYARLVVRLRQAAPGLRIAVDTSDAPLAALAAAMPAAAPDLIKPNGEELGQLAGLPAERAMALEDGAMRGEYGPVVEAARLLVERGVATVMATLGAAGAVLVTAEGAWRAAAPKVHVLSTVGAGDSSVAGYVLADVRGGDATERLCTAVAYGSAAAGLPGTALPTASDLPADSLVVTRLA